MIPEAPRVRYEELRTDLPGELAQLMACFDYRYSDEATQRALAFGSFDSMRAKEHGESSRRTRMRTSDAGDLASFKVRRGRSAGIATISRPNKSPRPMLSRGRLSTTVLAMAPSQMKCT